MLIEQNIAYNGGTPTEAEKQALDLRENFAQNSGVDVNKVFLDETINNGRPVFAIIYGETRLDNTIGHITMDDNNKAHGFMFNDAVDRMMAIEEVIKAQNQEMKAPDVVIEEATKEADEEIIEDPSVLDSFEDDPVPPKEESVVAEEHTTEAPVMEDEEFSPSLDDYIDPDEEMPIPPDEAEPEPPRPPISDEKKANRDKIGLAVDKLTEKLAARGFNESRFALQDMTRGDEGAFLKYNNRRIATIVIKQGKDGKDYISVNPYKGMRATDQEISEDAQISLVQANKLRAATKEVYFEMKDGPQKAEKQAEKPEKQESEHKQEEKEQAREDDDMFHTAEEPEPINMPNDSSRGQSERAEDYKDFDSDGEKENPDHEQKIYTQKEDYAKAIHDRDELQKTRTGLDNLYNEYTALLNQAAGQGFDDEMQKNLQKTAKKIKEETEKEIDLMRSYEKKLSVLRSSPAGRGFIAKLQYFSRRIILNGMDAMRKRRDHLAEANKKQHKYDITKSFKVFAKQSQIRQKELLANYQTRTAQLKVCVKQAEKLKAKTLKPSLGARFKQALRGGLVECKIKNPRAQKKYDAIVEQIRYITKDMNEIIQNYGLEYDLLEAEKQRTMELTKSMYRDANKEMSVFDSLVKAGKETAEKMNKEQQKAKDDLKKAKTHTKDPIEL